MTTNRSYRQYMPQDGVRSEIEKNSGTLFDWTIAAMVSQTSGLPMQIGNNEMNKLKLFFPGMTCLGDILKENGYTQELLIGSDADFAGRREFFSQHGDYLIADYAYAIEQGWIDPDYYVWWRYEDEKLFSFAKAELLRLAEEGEPFNLTMLTVDTHFPDGYICRLCEDKFPDNPYANAMACSSKQLAEFVYWIQQQDFYDDTTIVLMGDHPTMDPDFCDDVPTDYTRRVYTAYINSAVEPVSQKQRVYSTFDAFPTTLAAIGVEIPGDRLGLGTNLFSNTQTLCEQYGVKVMEKELMKNSHVIDTLQLEPVYDEIRTMGSQFIQPQYDYYAAEDNLYSIFDYTELSIIGASNPDALTIRLQDEGGKPALTLCTVHSDGSVDRTAPTESQDKTGDRRRLHVEIEFGKDGSLLDEWYVDVEDALLPARSLEMQMTKLFSSDCLVRISSAETREQQPGADQSLASALSIEIQVDYGENKSVQMTAEVDRESFPSYPPLDSDVFDAFLRALDNPDYAVFLSACDDATNGLTARAQKQLHALGLREDLTDKFRYSYCAVISEGTVMAEKLGVETQEASGTLQDGTFYFVSSSGYMAGSGSNIVLNGTEYSPAMRGFNIVVYDLRSQSVLTVRNFDTFIEP